MLGAMKAFTTPNGDSTSRPVGARGAWRGAAPAPRRGSVHVLVLWGLLAFVLPMLGACQPLTVLPAPPGQKGASPAIPGPFENYDPVRPPAYKHAPQPSPRPPARETSEPAYGGVLRPDPSGSPWSHGKRERDEE